MVIWSFNKALTFLEVWGHVEVRPLLCVSNFHTKEAQKKSHCLPFVNRCGNILQKPGVGWTLTNLLNLFLEKFFN